MKLPGILKKKWIYVLALIIIGGVWWYLDSAARKNAVTYETAPVEKRALVQTVEVTGEIKPAARIELSFKNGGTIRQIKVKVGDKVKESGVLAELKDDDVTFAARLAKAALNIAWANLNAKLAGETLQSIKMAEAQVEQSRASYGKTVADLTSVKLTTADSVKVAELAVQTAKSNLDNQDSIVSQNTQNAYDSARSTLFAALGPLQTGLSDGDQFSGVDNTAVNQMYSTSLGVLDSGSLAKSKASYQIAKQAKLSAEQSVKALTTASSKTDIQNAGNLVLSAIEKLQTFLTDIQRVLVSSIPSTYLTSADLTAKKTVIDTDRTTISTQNSSVLTALQSIKNTELTKITTIDQLQDAYVTAQTNLETAKTNALVQVKSAETAVTVQKAALDSSLAALDLKKAPPRAIDVESLRAAVEQAQVNYDKAFNDLNNIRIIAPVDGTVSEVLPDIGELIQPNITAIKLVGTSAYDIEALVPETDIAKVEVGQKSEITLDAYGDDLKFKGTVIAEDPDQTKVQDAIYYKIRVQIDPAGHDIKPGMTANVTITTGERENTLVVPLRAIRTTNGQKTVRILKDGKPEVREINVGLRGDEGRIEILKSLQEGEQVVVSESSPDSK